ncbi:MAG: VCBS repeat-containing protein [Pyrinomonadaceae bacterium]
MRKPLIHERSFALMLLIVITLSMFTGLVQAAASREAAGTGEMLLAPANDNFANAQLLSGVSGTVTGTTVAATKEAGEPAHALNKGGNSVWYKFVSPGTGVLSLDTFGSGFNTTLAVYVGSSFAGFTQLSASDNNERYGSGNIASNLSVGTRPGGIYFIAVDGFNNGGGAASGNVLLNFNFANAMDNDSFAGVINYHLAGSLKTSVINGTNVGASKEAGEPAHAGNAGGRSIWFKWSNPFNFNRTVQFTVDSHSLDNPNNPVDTLFAIYSGSSLANLTPVVSQEVSGRINVVLQAAPFAEFYLAIDGKNSGQGADIGNFTLTFGTYKGEKVPDFERDGFADLTVFRPTTGTWYSLDSGAETLRPMNFGANGDKPLVCDIDHNGRPDYTVFRPDIGVWYLLTQSQSPFSFAWGLNTDIPLCRSVYYDGINYQYPLVFRPSNGTWYVYVGTSGQAVPFGQNGDIPVSADFDGDGNDEYAVFRPSNGYWYILNTSTNQVLNVSFGSNGDKPVAADYDGDGRTDVAVFRPSTGAWYIIYSSNNSFHATQWGQNGDKPQPADYDNDGKADTAVFRSGTWYILKSSTGTLRAVQFGLANDIPVTSPMP